MSFCNNCGSQLPEGANVCPQCGAPIVPPAPRRALFSMKKAIAPIAKIFTFIMFGFAAVAILYGFINGIIKGVKYEEFAIFIELFFGGFFKAAIYVFFSIVSGYISKKFEE